jgi:hypothetical protein
MRLLAATADSIARYLADHADTLSINTLRHRLLRWRNGTSIKAFPIPPKHQSCATCSAAYLSSHVSAASGGRRPSSGIDRIFARQCGTSKETAQHFP